MKLTIRTILVPVIFLICLTTPTTADETLDKSDDCLDRMSWLEGHWRGDGFDGVCEAIWGPVMGGTRTGMFKLVKDDEVLFYEFIVIGMIDGVLTKRLRHFSADMYGWEAKDKWVEFPFVGCTDDSIEFEGLSYARIDENTVKVTVALRDEEGDPSPVELIYHRVKK